MKGKSLLPLLGGAFLLILWTSVQFIEWPIYGVLRLLDRAVVHQDSGFLLASASVLVLVNAARALLLYNGWFMIGGGLASLYEREWLERAVPLLFIPLSYFMTGAVGMPSVPHFGMPAVLGVLSVLVIQYLTREVSRLWNRLLALGMILFSLQWLDIIPALTSYGFGWGEISLALKEIASIMERDSVMNVVGTISFLGVFGAAMITNELFISYEKRLAQIRLLRRQERELNVLKEEQLRSRAIREIQYLVHDLKRPLTTITGLADVLREICTEEASRHADIILRASERMGQMISEIQSASAVQRITLGDALLYTMSQVRPLPWSGGVRLYMDDDARMAPIEVNLIRFSRALVNLIDNAHRATANVMDPVIELRGRASDKAVFVEVKDNGGGFNGTPRPHHSEWGSTGLGLAFVRDVIERRNGLLEFESGTCGALVRIKLPKKESV